ncbi:site-specific DNA-methyltransferase [Marinobacterium sedimentorum]|uniref:site-specific DNA-methyltransferase n=1 Tax=Marinobacterium sedimentorum TaxID=2927804 RepID=UPI0020C69607|nr:site-specific DNA-methyltransferase [Marinobacterium sedimentorum]MCP8685963.1 site-specific DNA-methyltransferase [Marinobacterium sedimentorum]
MEQVKFEDGQSLDVVSENIERLKELFPDAFSEGGVNFDTLRQLLGDAAVLDEGEEKYGLNWHGKKKARQIALTPSTGTLLPCPEESVDWDTTQNLFIEGDNLEVLKLLQKSYANKVKMIYIDPPYNTGKEFIYPDRFQENLNTYLKYTGQIDDEGIKFSSNTETTGRKHTNWLNMMYPRIKLAKSLLAQDGVIFISIHDVEQAHLRVICDDIFGEDNFIGNITWKARVKPVNVGEAKYRPQKEIEYVLVYQKKEFPGAFSPIYTGSERTYPHEINGRRYRLTTILKSNRGASKRTTMSFSLGDYTPPEGQRWQAGEDEINRLNREGYIEFKDGTPFRRYFEDEEGAEHKPLYCYMDSEWSSTSEAGKTYLNGLIGDEHGFDTVKPVRLIRTLIQAATRPNENDIVLDFFAGSCSSSDAVMQQNIEDAGNRRYIAVQLPEPAGEKSSFDSITELGLTRIRKCIDSLPDSAGIDKGFKIFKLSNSNIRVWNPDHSDLEESLLSHEEHLIEGRTEQDVLYELLLKRGVDLAVPIESREVSGKSIYSIGYGVLFACLDESISREQVEGIAQGILDWKAELSPSSDTHVFFRDSAFRDDVSKTNMAAILEQNGISHVRSL